LLYISLFFISFLSATLLPLGSEAFLLYSIENSNGFIALLILASIGNTLGSIVNYFLGLKGTDYLLSKKLIKAKYIDLSKRFFDRFGLFALLLSWVPIVGDPLTFMAGVFRFNIYKFIFIVLFAKSLRYSVLIYLYLS